MFYLFYLSKHIGMRIVVDHFIIEPKYFHKTLIYIYPLCYGQFIARIQLFLRFIWPLNLKATIKIAFK